MKAVEARSLVVKAGGRVLLEVGELELRPGETMLVYGPSGSGKTTLLRVLSGIIPGLYDGYEVVGEVLVYGSPPGPGSSFYVPQTLGSFFVGSTLEEELELCSCKLSGSVASSLGLDGLMDKRVEELSDGQRYRVLLAVALASGSRLLLLDEPTGHLDPWIAPSVISMISAYAESTGSAAVIVDHRVETVSSLVSKSLGLGSYGEDEPVRSRPRPRGAVLLEAANVSLELGGKTVVSGLSLEVREGEVVALLGPNGSGKTTLLRAAAGALKPSGGELRVARELFYVPQSPVYWFSESTVAGEVEVAASLRGSRLRAQEIMDALGLSGLEDRNPYSLSVGEARRLSIALALASGSRLLLLDEPVLGLDPPAKRAVARAVLEASSMGVGVLLATHDPELASWIADRTVRLR